MLKRFLLIIPLALLTSSCTPVEHLPSDEVLSRSAKANQNMKSSEFDLNAQYGFEILNILNIDGELYLEGTLQQSGEQIHFVIDNTSKIIQGDEPMDVQFNGEVITGQSTDTMIRIYDIKTNPLYPLFTSEKVEKLRGQWWRLPSDETQSQDKMLTPDTQMIRTQSEVVNVIADLGFDFVGKRRMYHYQTAVDPEKLNSYLTELSKRSPNEINFEEITDLVKMLDAKGEIWIDAQTFRMHKIKWSFAQISLSEAVTASLSFTMIFSEYNQAKPIDIPVDAIPLTQEYILKQYELNDLNILPRTLPTDQEDAIIERILNGA
ncbi:hypothetical protein KJ652_05640 [Patescibacteria group bacterium]|nr:hypothetical protein [Patescibacteria group bacterium]MBU1124044.1 hypothetical protein [Patescibacteria group bacterium]MBU1911255.1 hypothetical protein [Patescibacteria group bacterium]